ncbi:MAG: collagen-like protein, partial [Crocinitomicaceae bacterium]|nr:collagen-like protein [Crocinitomicaceae bacterium]
MKRIITLIGAVLITASAYAQAPQKMSYQAVIRDANQSLITNQPVGMQITILSDSINGTPIYSEIQTPTTNINGLISTEIGTGMVVLGNFSSIDWSSGSYYILTETDPTGGTAYSISGTSQMMSVPYALYAANSGSSTPGPQGPTGANGLNGANGSNGLQGPTGLTGANGLNGANGTNGADGVDGVDGINGVDGLPGMDGVDGIAGAVGPQGPIGLPGIDGVDGIDGTPGGPAGP